jgi:hypothetical protein
MKTIHDLVPNDQGRRDLMLARAYAINEYVLLEEALAALYTMLIAGRDIASVTWSFHRLSTIDRIKALKDLGKTFAPQAMDPFGNSVVEAVQKLAKGRNFIVHSHQITGAVSIDLASGRRTAEYQNFLVSPGIAFDLPSESKYFLPDVLSFARQVAFHQRHVLALHHLILGHCLPGWEEIVKQKYCAAPEKDNPAYKVWKEI